jgi:hypothetical protein
MSQTIQKRDFLNEDANTIYPKNKETIKASNGVFLPKFAAATPIAPNKGSVELRLQTALYKLGAEYEYSISLSADQDTTANWLSIKNENGSEFVIIKNLEPSFALYSRQDVGDDPIKIGSINELGDDEYVIEFEHKAINGKNESLGGITGGGDVVFVRSLKGASIKDADTIGSELLTNGGFEDWTSTYTPAFLTGANTALAVPATWAAVTDGSFTITIDGVERQLSAIDFTGDASMDDVAATIQAKIRTATGSLETVVWSTDHFVISSVATDETSAITVTSTQGTGTDISGANVMGCNAGSGVVTDAVEIEAPDGWTISSSGETPGYITDEETIVHTEGGSAITFVSGANHGTNIASQVITDIATGAYLQVDTWAYTPSDGGSTPGMLFLNAATQETATQVYIATGLTTGAWTDIVGGDISPGVLRMNIDDVEDAWAGIANLMIPRPDTGVVSILLFGAGSENDKCYMDDISVKTYTYAAAKTLFGFTNTTDAANLNENDTVIEFETTGGTDFNHLSMNGSGEFTTDYDDFNLSDKPVLVGNATNEEHALNAQTGYALLAVTGEINLKNTGATVFKNIGDITENYSLPSGYHLLGARIVTLVTAADTLTGDFQVSVGTNTTNYDNVHGNYSPGNVTVGQTIRDVVNYVGVNGDLYLNLVSADSGTSGTAKFLLFGTLVSTDIA